jgi:hypothetical protein
VKSTRVRAKVERRDAPVAQPNPVKPALSLADDTMSISAASPARTLQGQLSARLAEGTVEAKWSPRSTLIFIVGTCGAFWGAAYWAVSSAMAH